MKAVSGSTNFKTLIGKKYNVFRESKVQSILVNHLKEQGWKVVENLILESHLIPKEYIYKDEFKPEDYRDFLYARAELFCKKLKTELSDVEVEIVE